MKKVTVTQVNYFIAAVWMVSGLFCKVLNLVPRHREIITRILGDGHAQLWTSLVGFAEMGMGIWIFSGVAARLNAVIQIIAIATMNALEFTLAPDLLLWGRLNALFAFLFTLLIGYNNFRLKDHVVTQV
jgi:hypothetical protein